MHGENMNELMGRTHNDIDGTFCYGMLMPAGFDFGSRGQICVYRCSVCGREIRNLENKFGKSPFDKPTSHGFGPWG